MQVTLFVTGGPKTSFAGGALIFAVVPPETHPAEFFAVMVYVPSANRVNIPVVLVYDDPSMLYVMPEPVGPEILIVPDPSEQTGCMIEPIVGIAGAVGCGLITKFAARVEVHPPNFVTV